MLGLVGAERGEDDHDTRQGERWRWRSPPDLEENAGDGPGWTRLDCLGDRCDLIVIISLSHI